MQNSEAEVITISLNEYNDLLKCKEVIEEIADAVRNSENKIGPKICQSDSAPTSEASIIEKIEWLKLYINACRKTLLDFYSVKKNCLRDLRKK